jgi:hypothetical protein
MRVNAKFALELDALDYVEAAEHQKKLEVFLDTLRELYPTAALRFTARREAARRERPAPGEARGRRVAPYRDA